MHRLMEEHQEFTVWGMGKWDNKANIVDRAECQGLAKVKPGSLMKLFFFRVTV